MWKPYLAPFLLEKDRIEILALHYQYLENFLPDFKKELAVYSSKDRNATFSVVLKPSDRTNFEGDSVLEFRYNSTVIYRLTFSVVPGRILFSEAAEKDGILIGGSQGGWGCSEELRAAAKANHEIYPATMLVMAVQAVARSLGLDSICGIKSCSHVSEKIRGNSQGYLAQYDQLWEANGGIDGSLWYCLQTELSCKDLSAIPRNHRARAKRKRAVKENILLAMMTNVRCGFRGAAESLETVQMSSAAKSSWWTTRVASPRLI